MGMGPSSSFWGFPPTSTLLQSWTSGGLHVEKLLQCLEILGLHRERMGGGIFRGLGSVQVPLPRENGAGRMCHGMTSLPLLCPPLASSEPFCLHSPPTPKHACTTYTTVSHPLSD